MKLRTVLASLTLGLALLAACSSGDPVVDDPAGDDDDEPSGGGFDASTRRDAGDAARDGGGNPEDAAESSSDARTDGPAVPPVDAGHDASSGVDSGGADAATVLSFLGETKAYVTGQGQLGLVFSDNQSGIQSVTPANTVSVTTQTFDRGSVQEIHLFYDHDTSFANPVDLPMTFDARVNPPDLNDQWYAVIPAQAAGSQVYFYIQATPYAGEAKYDPPGFGVSLTYRVQN